MRYYGRCSCCIPHSKDDLADRSVILYPIVADKSPRHRGISAVINRSQLLKEFLRGVGLILAITVSITAVLTMLHALGLPYE